MDVLMRTHVTVSSVIAVPRFCKVLRTFDVRFFLSPENPEGLESRSVQDSPKNQQRTGFSAGQEVLASDSVWCHDELPVHRGNSTSTNEDAENPETVS